MCGEGRVGDVRSRQWGRGCLWAIRRFDRAPQAAGGELMRRRRESLLRRDSAIFFPPDGRLAEQMKETAYFQDSFESNFISSMVLYQVESVRVPARRLISV